jgi:hypothetical protein
MQAHALTQEAFDAHRAELDVQHDAAMARLDAYKPARLPKTRIVFQVVTFQKSDVEGENEEHCSPCFPGDDQDGALRWAQQYVQSFPDEYALILQITPSRRSRSGGWNTVVWDSRLREAAAADQAVEDEFVYQQEIALR